LASRWLERIKVRLEDALKIEVCKALVTSVPGERRRYDCCVDEGLELRAQGRIRHECG
jgi:hypothetical protein